jgi:hypothetical protein
MTLSELDEILAEATTKAVNEALAAGFPVIYWEDGQTIILHPDGTKDAYPAGVRPPTMRNLRQ